MTPTDIERIVAQRLFPGHPSETTLLETHISWIILTDVFAFKIKKPVHFHFLDFKTPAARQHFCEEELRLNQRLVPDIYLGVLPVGSAGIGDPHLPRLDSALWMRRMDNSREMDKLLRDHLVTPADMEHLAALLAPFHRQNRLYPTAAAYDVENDIALFADLFTLQSDWEKYTGDTHSPRRWKKHLRPLLQELAPHLSDRAQRGFRVDGHGDLHSRNIILPPNKTPIVFDCLEFNPDYRRMDVLSELAFLCMDLEFYGQNDLSAAFLAAYQRHWSILENATDHRCFTFYKAYRANVRLKITLLELGQHPTEALADAARSYGHLLKIYTSGCLGADTDHPTDTRKSS